MTPFRVDIQKKNMYVPCHFMFLDLLSLANLVESLPRVFLQFSVSPHPFHLVLSTSCRERDHFNRHAKLSLLTFTEKKLNEDKTMDLAWFFFYKSCLCLERVWSGMDFPDTPCSSSVCLQSVPWDARCLELTHWVLFETSYL